jgi:PAS domain S-box-containing protein
MIDSPRRSVLYGILGALSLAFFFVDVLLPDRLAVELMQVAVVLLTLFVPGRRSTLLFGGLATLLVGGSYLLHGVGDASMSVVVNHGLVLLGLWMAVAVVLGYKHVLRARHESEARARAVLDTTIDGILTFDAEGTIESFNPAAEEIFGYDATALAGAPVTRLLAPSDRGTLEAALRTYRETGRADLVGSERVLQGRREDGTTFPMALSLSEIGAGHRGLFTGIVRDVTEREEHERRLTTQYLTARVLTDSDSLDEAAPRLLQTVCEQLDWKRGELWMPTDDGARLENAETWEQDDASSPLEQATDEVTFRRGEGLPGVVWEERRPHWMPDVRTDDTFQRRPAARADDMRAGFAVPIRLDDTVMGVLVFFSRDIREPDDGLLQMFSVIGNQIGQFVERRETEAALQRTAERLSRAQHIAGLGSWQYDLDDGTMTWSDQMYRLFEVDPDAFTPSLERVKEFLPPDDREQFEDMLARVRAGSRTFRLKHRLQPREGGTRWMLTQGEVEGTKLVGTTLDTTALNRAQKALEESEARAQAILETTVDGIITIDADGIIESFNDAAEDIFGYDEGEVVGENVKVLMPSPYREEHDGYLQQYHETGRRNIIGVGREVTGLRKDGSTFPMDLAVSEVELGTRTIFTGIVRDISERRRLEKEILNVSEQERRRIGQDLHDGLGQMLTGIGLLSQDVARQLEEEGHPRADDMQEITEHIKEADQYARDLSHGLIPVDVEANGLSEALRRLSTNAERLFNVDCDFREVGTARVHDNTTATHLYRIAQEAVNNAVRHGAADQVRVTLAAGGEQIRLQVRDDGTGFDETDADDAGMGVHIMNYRARIIGGTLELSSDVGEGTVVTCTLPRAVPAAEASAVDGQANDAPSKDQSGSSRSGSASSCPV